jgi:hypothetical protein
MTCSRVQRPRIPAALSDLLQVRPQVPLHAQGPSRDRYGETAGDAAADGMASKPWEFVALGADVCVAR